MTRNLFRTGVLGLWLGALGGAVAAVPPAEQLLPADTLAVVGTADAAKFRAARQEAALWRLWNDPLMRPFREKLTATLTKEVVEPLERQLGLKLADYADLLQGQCTLALTQNGWTGTSSATPGFLLLVDARDKSDLLKTNLTEIRRKLNDAGKQVKHDRLRDVEFTTLVLSRTEMQRVFQQLWPGAAKASEEKKSGSATPEAANPKEGDKLTLSFGQVDSLLLVGTNQKDLEQVLARLAGGNAPCLADQSDFATDQRAVFRDTVSYGWVHLAPLMDIAVKRAAEAGANTPPDRPSGPRADRILGALGLTELRTLAVSAREDHDGGYVDFFLGAPEAKRKGLFQLLATEGKEASPPAFVPADVVQFTRWRGDGQKLWATIEATMNEISPGTLNFVLTQMESALKQKDPNFDFRKSLVANLGDDVISYQKAPRSLALADVEAPPSLFLLGSGNADQLLQAFRLIMVMLPGPTGGTELKDREFLGRKIYYLPLPPVAQPGGGAPKERTLSLAASGGYVALTTDAAMLEEYLRSGDAKAKPLQETPGWSDATQRLGGTASGFFGYQNDAENVRTSFEAMRNNADSLSKAFASSPLAAKLPAADRDKVFKEWLDFSLLPPFDKVAKYFYMTVYAGKTTSEGLGLRMFTPTPPQLRQP